MAISRNLNISIGFPSERFVTCSHFCWFLCGNLFFKCYHIWRHMNLKLYNEKMEILIIKNALVVLEF